VPLTAEQWAHALLLGEARQCTNKARARSADRGAQGNHEVDLHGALGELLLYGRVRGLRDSDEGADSMRRQLFCITGGRDVQGADLRFIEDGVTIAIDVKTYDCSPSKRYFAINDNKHRELADDSCIGYVGLVCPRLRIPAIVNSKSTRW
jgi:hypothetical protein